MPFYTPPKQIHTYDRKYMTAVPVIAAFSVTGAIKPLYVELENTPLKILKYHSRAFTGYTHYYCTVPTANAVRDIILTLHLGEHVWTVKY